MFTGLVQEVGTIQKSERQGTGLWLSVEAPRLAPKFKTGDSLAVNGCCLTVVEVRPPLLSFQAVPETLERTLLGKLKPGDVANLEPPLTLLEPLGGHLVQGHVDGLGQITSLEKEGDGARLRVRVPAEAAAYVVEKGSIALDGVSLTVAAVKGDEVEIALIPHTLQNTRFKALKVGDQVQVEADLLAKYVQKLSAPYRAPGGSHES